MRKISFVFSILLFIAFGVASYTLAGSGLSGKKQTDLGLYLTAREAYAGWKADSEKFAILDVRTPEEYIFVGHAPMALNIPLKIFNQQLTMARKKPVMKLNPNFTDEVKKHFETNDKILVMCRSGSRSAKAVNLLAKAGFKAVYNITDGFEGDTVKDAKSYFKGKRLKNGWKNSGAPWTYKIDPKLMY